MKVTYIDNSDRQYEVSADELSGNIDGLVVKGRLWLGDRDSASFLQLKHRGVTHVLNCEKDLHGISKEKDLVDYCNLDPEEGGKAALIRAFEFLEQQLSENSSNVLVHCLNGNGRSCGILLYYLMRKLKISLANAHRRLAGIRPNISPRPGLVKLLIEEEARLRPGLGPSVQLNEKRQIVYTDGADAAMFSGLESAAKTQPKAKSSAAAKGSKQGGWWGLISLLIFLGVTYCALDYFINAGKLTAAPPRPGRRPGSEPKTKGGRARAGKR